GSTPQSGTANQTFTNPLAVTVTAVYALEPVDGGLISFAAPTDGASATLSAATVTIANGVAGVFGTANATLGSYSVTATASGGGPVDFDLTNIEAPSLVVTTTLDEDDDTDGTTSLREALAYAESLPGPETVTFDPAVFGTAPQKITLTLGALSVTE